jgi:alpha-tubulin suppressor-like RCC1 family protein
MVFNSLKQMKSTLQFGLALLLLGAMSSQATPTVTQAAAGSGYSLFLTSDGSLWGMGDDEFGQLGVEGFFETNRPEETVSNNVVAIAAGGNGFHTLFIKSDGSLWGMGYNEDGELGDGTYSNPNRPEEIVSNGVVAIAAGGSHSLFLKSDGSLWVMGDNEYGQLGDSTYNNTNQPEEIVSNNVVTIAAGGFYSLFIKSDGSLWAIGDNEYGQLGDGTYNNTNQPEEIVSNDVAAITAGDSHSLFLKSDGSLWVMGFNYYGQLGDGTYNNTNRPEEIVSNDVVAIAGGTFHSLFIKSDGSLWGMGWNYRGQLGDGTYNNVNKPEEIVSNDVVAIAGGNVHSLFIKSDGSLWGMGDCFTGELGDGFIGYYYGLFYYRGFNPFPEQIFPPPQPVLTLSVLSPNTSQVNATCHFGGNFYLYYSPTLTRPLGAWQGAATIETVNVFSNNNYSLTLPPYLLNSPGFYILQSH